MHPVEDRVVGRTETVSGTVRVVRRPLHGLDIARRVDAQEQILAGQYRCQPGDGRCSEYPERLRQGDRELQADRVQGMIAAEGVVEHGLVPDHRDRVAHPAHGSDLDSATACIARPRGPCRVAR
ncbi:MAG: hypothetical protein WKF47_04615 [Geodermatophilaceae bacterium]